jgi:hypothetical protein
MSSRIRRKSAAHMGEKEDMNVGFSRNQRRTCRRDRVREMTGLANGLME